MRGVLEATRIEGASPCPHSNHTSSSPSGNSSKPSCPRGKSTIRSAATGLASRSSGLREARCGSGLRLRLLEDRRREVFGDHDKAKARRVDGGRSDGRPGGDRFGILRPDDRPRAFRRVGRRVHNEGPVRRREIGQKPGRSRKAGHQALHDGGRRRHPPGGGRGGSQPPRLAASLLPPSTPPRARRRWSCPRCQRPPRSGLRLERRPAGFWRSGGSWA